MKTMVKEKVFFYLIFAVLVLGGMFALQGCAAGSDDLDGTSWQLTSLGTAPLLPKVPVTISFDGENAGGNASCNSYFASVSIKAETITFDGVGMTEMYCMDEGVMEQESAYLQALPGEHEYHLKDGSLIIALADGTALVFAPAE